MSYTVKDYMQAINSWTEWSKFDGQANLKAVLDLLAAEQWLPSRVTILRAVRHLGLRRTDGGSQAKDAKLAELANKAAYNAALKNLRALPLEKVELEEFGSLSFQDLQRQYYQNRGFNPFRARYDMAVEQFGFRVPEPPTEVLQAAAEVESTVSLTAEEYNAMSSEEARRKYAMDLGFKKCVDALIKAGQI